MNFISAPKARLLFSVAILIFAGVSVFSYPELAAYVRAEADHIRSTRAANGIDRLGTLVVETDLDERGFLLTGNDLFLKSYAENAAQVSRMLSEINEAASSKSLTASEHLLYKSLSFAIQHKLDEFNFNIEAKKNGHQEEALANISSGESIRNTNSVKKIVAEIARIESTFTGHAITGAKPDLRSEMLFVGFCLLLAVLASAAGWFLFRNARKANPDSNEDWQRFSLLVQNSTDLIAISDADRILQYVNEAGRGILGIAKEKDIKGCDATQFYSDAFNHRMNSEVIPAVKENGSWNGEFCYQNAITKELIPVLMNVFPLKHPVTGAHLGMAVVSRDIRDRKKLEKQLDRFFEVSLDMLGIANTQGYFLRLNPAFSEILGYTEEELCSRPCTDFIHPDDISSTIEQIERQAGGGNVLSFENRYRTKSGDYRWFSWKSSPDGDITYGAARDITEEKQQKLLMDKLRQQAVAASEAKSEFLANMSHEIRTPINGVIGMTTLLLDSPLNPEQLDYAGNIIASAESLLTVINDILDFSKIEAGKLDFEKVDFSLENLIDETAKSISWGMKNKSLPFIVSCERESKRLFRGDPGRIRQILTNLLSNAVKFTKIGSIKLEVQSVKKESGATQFHFSVKDTGIGLSSETQKKLFQAFSQADASTTRKFGGTGLGLSICKRLVELMDGEIGVESVEGVGSNFWFTLTLEHSQESVGKSKSNVFIPKSNYPEAQILIAEDNFINQKILLAMLDKIGLKAQAVGNGVEVLSILRERSFDLILMDCQMPDLDGYATTKKIRESDELDFKDIPIIAMTANALKGDRERCLHAGMNDYASKPVSIHDLAVIVEKWLVTAETRKNSVA